MAKALVKLVSGLELTNEENQLEITFNSEFLIIEEKGFRGFKSVVENTFKIPLANFLGSKIETGTDVFDKVIHAYIVSFVSSNGEVRNITFKMPFLMISVTQKFDKKLKTQLINVPRSEAVINILKQAQEQEQFGKPDVIL
ncbi:hypothetical protein [Paenibacillus radicis (ex Gao et al. 2016)]|uniref:Uncharacterized protein n=1 Tax=Paenibacillus radicis (ex Gao et al. 2016) TaxID=1737354 RepID=A0A917M6E8_9BACL|nr:hypothetical protein [Paenibacillus radicis (ex Gao et al. 2016)]GGG81901.1 hypothetical protein GCM10010918_44030 [Paenibacillus radicis (ex Gao et al. 2016)]